MKSVLPIAFFAVGAFGALNGHCTGSKATGIYKAQGICITTSKCDSYEGGTYISGACPNDPNNVKCCIIGACVNSSHRSFCGWTEDGCTGTWHTNRCPGGSNFKCCETSGKGPTPV